MKQMLKALSGFFAIAATSFALVACSGCKTTLQSGGPYGDDTLLYRAELTSVSSYQLVDSFLKWENDNRELLSAYPEIKKSADFLRENFPKAKMALDAAIEVYRKFPTNENGKTLTGLITTIQEQIKLVSTYTSP